MAHEVTLEQLDGLAWKAAHVALRRVRIRLDERRAQDLHDFLVELGVRMARDYDPSFEQAFSTWYYRRARQRVIDWLRKTHGDPRNGGGMLSKLEVNYPSTSLDTFADAAPNAHELAVSDPEPDPLSDAIVELGSNLSPDARWALVNVAGRITEGATEKQALHEAAGTSRGPELWEAEQRFALLREELRRLLRPESGDQLGDDRDGDALDDRRAEVLSSLP